MATTVASTNTNQTQVNINRSLALLATLVAVLHSAPLATVLWIVELFE